MSTLSGFSCDYCGKKVEDNGEGIWIRSDTSSEYIAFGRSGKTGSIIKRLDFCSIEHMVKFIEERCPKE